MEFHVSRGFQTDSTRGQNPQPVEFLLVKFFQMEEADRRKALGTSTERPENILLADRGIQLTLLRWLISVIGIIHKLKSFAF
jgi:hypothetical protein